jgi:hypothetical protein
MEMGAKDDASGGGHRKREEVGGEAMAGNGTARADGMRGDGVGGGKRVADRRSPDSMADSAQNRRVKRAGGSWADSGGLDDVEAALPETLDLSGRAELTTQAMRLLIVEQPRTCILKLDGCLVSCSRALFPSRPLPAPPTPCTHTCACRAPPYCAPACGSTRLVYPGCSFFVMDDEL